MASHRSTPAALSWNSRVVDPPAPRPAGPSAHEQLTRRYPLPATPSPIPTPADLAPYRLELDRVLGPARATAVQRAGQLRFHCVGDTGGQLNPVPQRAVAAAMATELTGPDPVSFLYHLGDVVYPHGERSGYRDQFHAAYDGYNAPILGLPGNHDGEGGVDPGAGPLAAFTAQFCGGPGTSPGPERRAPLAQPNVHWTLCHRWVTIIGLYTGVPDGGHLGSEQQAWLTDELNAASRGVPLLLAMHHPVFSADVVHGSNLALRDVIDECCARAGRRPDAVVGAHAHNYQRFSRSHDGRPVPYIVAGCGGYPELHRLAYGIPAAPAAFAGLPGVTLEAHQHAAFGFLTITVKPVGARIDYSTVVRRRPVHFDSVLVRPT